MGVGLDENVLFYNFRQFLPKINEKRKNNSFFDDFLRKKQRLSRVVKKRNIFVQLAAAQVLSFEIRIDGGSGGRFRRGAGGR